LLRIVHSALPGRIRYKVAGLYRCEEMRDFLVSHLARTEPVQRVSANVLTGNILIIFDPLSNPKVISSLLQSLVVNFEKKRSSARDRRIARGRVRQLLDESLPSLHSVTEIAQSPDNRKGTSAGWTEKGPQWHSMDCDAVLKRLNSSPYQGLAPAVARQNQVRYGLNVFPEAEARSGFAIFVDQFKSMPVALLAVAAGVSVLTGGLADAVVIMAVVGINAIIGYFTESDAEKTISSLKSLVRPSALVKREGTVHEIPAREILVGDILVLKPGTYVAADARLVEVNNLTVDESALTGESVPAVKRVHVLSHKDIPLSERSNMVYAGTLVTGGQGLGAAIAVGRATEIGKVQALVSEATPPETLMERELNRTGNQLVAVSSAICGLVFVLGLLRGGSLLQLMKMAISLAVAAVPEGLPAVATTTLALGVKTMRRNKVLIRDLEAVCTLGSIQTICLDKTGTLTRNRMSVVRVHCGERSYSIREGRFEWEGENTNPYTRDDLLTMMHVCVLCNETHIESKNGNQVLRGSSTENALIEMAISAGVDVQWIRQRYPRLGIHYRSEARQSMSTVHAASENGRLLAFKGSPLEILAKCTDQSRDGVTVPLSEMDRDAIELENERMAGDALRVLGIAYRTGDHSSADIEESNLTWLGLIGMTDPVREGVKESIKAFHAAGVDTVMITGDQSATAYAVGRELELNNGNALRVLDATDLQGAGPGPMKALCRDVNVFARVSPSHKLLIVQALQEAGKVVAMTGDGINDGPALKAADVGIAMGHAGTDVAREIAEVVLEEDGLETLIIALSEGRTIYNNIRKTVHYLLATNFSEVMVTALSVGMGLGYPLTAMQLLWINLVSDIFPGLALALEAPEPDVLNRPPRDPQEPLVRKHDLKRIAFEGTTMTVGALAAYAYGIRKYGTGPIAGTIAFQSLTLSQILHAYSCRSESHTIFDGTLQPNKYLTAAIVGSLGLQVIAQVVPGVRNLLGSSRIGMADGIFIAVPALISLLVSELSKKANRGDTQ